MKQAITRVSTTDLFSPNKDKAKNEVICWLSKALRVLKPYHGEVVRYEELSDEVINYYVPGKILTYIKHTSTNKTGELGELFTDRNCIFHIMS